VNDWDAVRREINRQCPEWRDQVVAKSGSLNGP
jgi:hypothetical protein